MQWVWQIFLPKKNGFLKPKKGLCATFLLSESKNFVRDISGDLFHARYRYHLPVYILLSGDQPSWCRFFLLPK